MQFFSDNEPPRKQGRFHNGRAPRSLTVRPPARGTPGGLRLYTRMGLCMLLGALLCALIMGACAGKGLEQEKRNILASRSGNFNTSANITYKDLKATAIITRETPQACAVVFESPASLRDMSFIFRGDAVDLGYKGLSFSFDPSTLPGGAVARIAVSSINKAMKDDGVAIGYEDGAVTLSGVMDSGEFTLRLDGENGNLLKLFVPAEELEIEFLNFTFLD